MSTSGRSPKEWPYGISTFNISAGKDISVTCKKDGTILYTEPPHTVDDERIIRPADPYVFRVRDEYHQLFIDHYYDGEDYTSAESEQSGELDDSSSE